MPGFSSEGSKRKSSRGGLKELLKEFEESAQLRILLTQRRCVLPRHRFASVRGRADFQSGEKNIDVNLLQSAQHGISDYDAPVASALTN